MTASDLQRDQSLLTKKRFRSGLYLVLLILSLLFLAVIALSLGGLAVSYEAIVKGLFVAYDPKWL